MEEPLQELFENSNEVETEIDGSLRSLLTSVKKRQKELSSKILALKSSTESLREQLKVEKRKWLQEIQETAELETKFKKCHDSQRTMLNINESQRKLEIFKEYLFFTQTTQHLEMELKKKNYQDWLSEIASECNQELTKVQDSLTVLRPLKEIASKWSIEEKMQDDQIEQNYGNDETGQGDSNFVAENTNISVE